VLAISRAGGGRIAASAMKFYNRRPGRAGQNRRFGHGAISQGIMPVGANYMMASSRIFRVDEIAAQRIIALVESRTKRILRLIFAFAGNHAGQNEAKRAHRWKA